jgi:hypothetical protein
VSTHSIVALFASLSEAEQAEQALKSAGIPGRDIALSAQVAAFGEAGARVMGPARSARPEADERRYFEWLVGAEVADGRILRYRELLDGGACLICVRVPEQKAEEARAILRRHLPVDLDDGEDDEGNGLAFAGGKPGASSSSVIDEYLVGDGPVAPGHARGE